MVTLQHKEFCFSPLGVPKLPQNDRVAQATWVGGSVQEMEKSHPEKYRERRQLSHVCVCPGGAVSQKSHDQLNLFGDGLILKIAMMVSSYICIAIAINSDIIPATLCGKKNQMPNMLH